MAFSPFSPLNLGRNNPMHELECEQAPVFDLQQFFSNKIVLRLNCASCGATCCHRGMSALLLADNAVSLFSTDQPTAAVVAGAGGYAAQQCLCGLGDLACDSCGRTVGYHVAQPCAACLRGATNGHRYVFHGNAVTSAPRAAGPDGDQPLLWADIPSAADDVMRAEPQPIPPLAPGAAAAGGRALRSASVAVVPREYGRQ